MQGLIRCVSVTGLLISCGGGDNGLPDAPSTGDAGLMVAWSSAPSMWPGDAGDGVTIERARFAFDLLRVIGDASAGDPRTTASAFEVRWDTAAQPAALAFDQAPPGLYSQVAMQIDGPQLDDDSYEIRGRVDLGDDGVTEFRIEDRTALALNVDIEQTLSPGATETIRLRVNFVHAIDSIDWRALPKGDGGVIVLDQTSSQMPAFRAALVESFELVGN